MDRCPSCNAALHGKSVCHRCKADLSSLRVIEEIAETHRLQALFAWRMNDFDRMFFHARRAFSLYRTPESRALMACAALLTKQFATAMSLWKPKRRNAPVS